MENEKKPNILFIMADQFRHDALGANGNPVIKTPNYDRLAKMGVNFTHSFTPNPICVPARASVITGCYPHKCTGGKSNGGRIKEGFPVLAGELADSGYETYSVGKLHYDPYTPPGQPRLTHGFKHVELCESGRMLAQFDPKHELAGVEDYHDYLKTVGWGGYSRGNGMGNNDVYPNVSALPEEHYVDSWVASRAIHYMENHLNADPDKPFFMHASFPKPHSAFDPPHPWNRMYDPREMPPPIGGPEDMLNRGHNSVYMNRRTFMWDKLSPEAARVIKAHYYGLISFQDKQTGRLLDFLENKGILNDTIIVFTADHGEMLGDFGIYFKTVMYNGSVRVPLMFAYPRKLKSGVKCETPAALCDIFPTLLCLAGVDKHYDTDGIDLTGAMNGRFPERRYVASQCFSSPDQRYMLADSRYKYMYAEENGVEELYDQLNDPCELHNLINRAPDKTREMRAALFDWCKQNGDMGMLSGDGFKTVPGADLNGWQPNYGVFGRRWY